MKTADKLKVKRIRAAIDALDDYHKTVSSFNIPMARMLLRLSKARKAANRALAKVNSAYGSEMIIEESELREVIPVSEYIEGSKSAKMNTLRMIMSLKSVGRLSDV
jgi:sirohydrochlorin ferrochelatase